MQMEPNRAYGEVSPYNAKQNEKQARLSFHFVSPSKSLFAAKPFSSFLGKNPSRFKNSPNWDIHPKPENITNEKEGVRKGLRTAF